MTDNFNSYYTRLITGLQETYATLKGGTIYKETPPSFPYMYFKQIDGSTAMQTLSNTEVGINLGIQIEIYSTETSTEARKISKSVRDFMVSLGFQCTYYQPVENAADTSIYRFVGRYEKVET